MSTAEPAPTIRENMTREETSDFLRCGLTKLWDLEKKGKLKPSFRLGRRVLYRRADVLRFVERESRRAARASR